MAATAVEAERGVIRNAVPSRWTMDSRWLSRRLPGRRAHSSRFRRSARVGGVAAAVVALVTGGAFPPAHSRPVPPDPVATGPSIETPTQNCFIGQPSWPVATMGRQPQCTVAERVASHPRGGDAG